MRGSMLYQELPPIDSTRLDGWGRWLVPAVVVGAAVTAAFLLLLLGQLWFAAGAIFAGLAGAAYLYLRDPSGASAPVETLVAGPDFSLVGSALSLSREPVALTSSEGSLLIVN